MIRANTRVHEVQHVQRVACDLALVRQVLVFALYSRVLDRAGPRGDAKNRLHRLDKASKSLKDANKRSVKAPVIANYFLETNEAVDELCKFLKFAGFEVVEEPLEVGFVANAPRVCPWHELFARAPVGCRPRGDYRGATNPEHAAQLAEDGGAQLGGRKMVDHVNADCVVECLISERKPESVSAEYVGVAFFAAELALLDGWVESHVDDLVVDVEETAAAASDVEERRVWRKRLDEHFDNVPARVRDGTVMWGSVVVNADLAFHVKSEFRKSDRNGRRGHGDRG